MAKVKQNKVAARSFILHPFFFAIYTVLAPLAVNVDMVGLGVIRSLLIAFVGVALLSFTLRLLIRDPIKAGLLTSGGIVLFGTYGHVSKLWMESSDIGDALLYVQLVIWVGLGVGWIYWVFRRIRNFRMWNRYFNVTGFFLLVLPMFRIVSFIHNTPDMWEKVKPYHLHVLSEAGVLELATEEGSTEPKRDIYYIILDGYTRADVLQALYDYDNEPFLAALEDRGFYIATEGHSNYPNTEYSLASSLNMAHVNDAPDVLRSSIDVDQEKVLSQAVALLIKHNRVTDFFKDLEYEIIAFDSGFDKSSIAATDSLAKSPDIMRFNAEAAFELMVMDTTLGKLYLKLRGEDFVPLQSLFDDHRGRVLYALEHVSDYADDPGPQFVFAHILSPHAPYVFTSTGEPRHGVDPFTLLDDRMDTEWSPSLYRDQVIFINTKTLQMVDEILAKSELDPIIIIQADHSSRAWVDLYPSAEIRQQILYPIFLALYLPDGVENVQPYADISPVNIFRLILNRYFGMDLDMLMETRYFLVNRDGRLGFEDACIAIGGCDGNEEVDHSYDS